MQPKFIIMLAIVKIAGQQFKISKDQTLYVPHLGGEIGDKVSLDTLFTSNNGSISLGSSISVTAEAEIVEHVKGDTVIAYKQKRRKGFHKKKGHRTAYTKIKVLDIA